MIYEIDFRLENVFIGGATDGQPKLHAKSVWVVIKFLPLLQKRIETRKLIVEGSSLKLIRDAEGRFNVGAIREWAAKPAESGLFKVLKTSLITRFEIRNSKLSFIDYYLSKDQGKEPDPILVNNLQ